MDAPSPALLSGQDGQHPRPQSAPGHHQLPASVTSAMDSRVTTPSSPGSTSGESLSALDESDAAINNDDSPDDLQLTHSAVASPSSTSTTRLPASSSNGARGVHHSLNTPSNANPGSSGSGSHHSTSIASRRRHHHHQHHHSLTLGTGSAKMGSSITDSAQSTEDEMYDDEDREDAEDERPRVLYPALATPKAAGNNFWPFGTTGDKKPSNGGLGGSGGDEQVHTLRPEAVAASSSKMDDEPHHRHPQLATHNPATLPTSLQRNHSLTGSDSGAGRSNSLAAYRSQVHAASGANAAFLPHEILLKILRNVRSTEDLVSSLQVCKSWCQCGVELLWNKPLFPHVGPLIKMLVVLSKQSSSTSSSSLSSSSTSSFSSSFPETIPPTTSTTTFQYSNFIKRLNFSQLADKMSDTLLIRLSICNRLERLTLAGCLEITDNSLVNLLSNCKNLVALDLSDCGKITNETVTIAARNCKRLQGLNLSGCKLVTDDGIEAVAKGCPLLRRVKLRNLDTLTDDAIIALVLSCPLLLEVDLYACTSITDRTLWALFRNSSHLRELSLNNCTQITGDGFPQKDGKMVYIKGSDDAALVNLKPLNSKLANLSHKSHQGGTGGDTSLVSTSFQVLPPNTTLLSQRLFDHVRYMDLTGMINLTDTAMAGIVATMPHVRNLVLAKCSNLTDESVLSICRLGKHIHFLHLGHVSNITDKAVTTLARACTRLRYIDLACCPNLTDLSVFELAANLPRLKRIGLVRVSNLTDQAIFALAERTTLERIHLSYCEHVSVSAVQFLLSRLNRLNHLSLTGVPAFRRADLQHFCRPPPKDFNPHQRSTFCVYSGKGVHELRKHLMALQQSELHQGSSGLHSTLLPQGLYQQQQLQGNLHAQQQQQLQLHHHQFAQLQLGNQMQQQQHQQNHHQHLPTYPHLFQHTAGHAVISQMPLQAQAQAHGNVGDAGDDVDEDVDEDDEDNGDDEADEDGLRGASRRSLHSAHTHGHRHGSSTASVHAGYRQNTASYGSTFAPPPYYRTNHRMTGRIGELLEDGDSSISTGTLVASGNAPGSSPASTLGSQQAHLANGVAPPRLAASTSANRYYQYPQPSAHTSSSIAWSNQLTGSEPTTRIRGQQNTLQASNAVDVTTSQPGRLGAGARPFTPARGSRSPVPTGSDSSNISMSLVTSAADSLMDMQQNDSDFRQRSHSVDMDLNTEDEPQFGNDIAGEALSRTARPRRDTIMQATYRHDS